MRLTWTVLFVLGALTSCSGSHGQARSHPPFEALATSALSEIQHGNCAPTAARFDATMKSALDAAGLCSAYVTYTQVLGAVTHADPAYSEKRGQLTVVRMPLQLAHGKGEYRMAYHPDGRIAGLYFLKAGVPLS